jgi:hypothetical protein
MVQDSTKNFLFKNSGGPAESPAIKERKEFSSHDSLKIKYIEKYVPKSAKKKENARNKEPVKKVNKVNISTNAASKTKDKKKGIELKQEKKSVQKADSIFRFVDTENNEQPEKTSIVRSPENVNPIVLPGQNQLKQIHTHPLPVNKDNTDWVFFTLLISCTAFIWVKVFYRKIFEQITQAFFNNRITNQIVRDENILVQKASVLLTIIFNLVASLFLYQISILFSWNPDYLGGGFNRYLIFAFAVSFIYTIKFIGLKVIGNIFKIDKGIAIYIFNIFLINNLLGIALLPILTFISFSKSYALYGVDLALILIGVAFVYRLVRGFLIGLTYGGFSLLYLFLYLCALEIAPVMVLFKLLTIKSF